MDNRIPPVRSDVVTVPSAARPTPTPVRVSFGQVLAKGAGVIVSGAENALDMLPGGSLVAAAIRGGSTPSVGPSSTMMSGSGLSIGGNNAGQMAEGPQGIGGGSSVGGGFGTGGASTGGVNTGSMDQSLQQSQDMNLYFLQIQQEVNAQNQTFTTLSNVMKSESDTIKNAIGNLR
ncbi:MAG TPA: hypothetical protein VGH28_11870 [Polyangiaceae bacterium]|jgi:hypothetical protein